MEEKEELFGFTPKSGKEYFTGKPPLYNQQFYKHKALSYLESRKSVPYAI